MEIKFGIKCPYGEGFTTGTYECSLYCMYNNGMDKSNKTISCSKEYYTYTSHFRINQVGMDLLIETYSDRKYDMNTIIHGFKSRYPTYKDFRISKFKIEECYGNMFKYEFIANRAV